MNELEKIISSESIKKTKARYFHCLDTKAWEMYSKVFTEDAEMDMREETGDEKNIILGRKNIAEYVQRMVGTIITAHHGHTPLIEFTSDLTAEVVWAMEDKLWVPDGENSSRPLMHGHGHYRETYQKIDDQWLIHRLKLTRLHIDFFNPTHTLIIT